MTRKRHIMLASLVLMIFVIAYLYATQSYRTIPYMPFKIATCPYENGLYMDIYDMPTLIAFPGQGSDNSAHLVVRNWWGQIIKESQSSYGKNLIKDPCGQVIRGYFNKTSWERILPLWVTAPVEVSVNAIIINKHREVLFLHFGNGTMPDTSWPRGRLGLFNKGDKDPEQFLIKIMQEHLPFNIISVKETYSRDYKMYDGSISHAVYFVVLVEHKSETSMSDLPPTTPDGIPATYQWYDIDSEYAENEMWLTDYEKILSTIDEMLMP